ncbi:MAG: hypothetical protein ACXWKH_20880 [Limisphaerales bacterium]
MASICPQGATTFADTGNRVAPAPASTTVSLEDLRLWLANPSLAKHNKVLNLHNRSIGVDAYSAGGTAKRVGPASFSLCASVRLTGATGTSAQACGNPTRDNKESVSAGGHPTAGVWAT